MSATYSYNGSKSYPFADNDGKIATEEIIIPIDDFQALINRESELKADLSRVEKELEQEKAAAHNYLHITELNKILGERGSTLSRYITDLEAQIQSEKREKLSWMSEASIFMEKAEKLTAQLREAKLEIEFQKITMEGTEEELQAAQQQAVAYKAELKKEIYRAEHCLECGGNVRCVSMCLFRELNPEIAIDASKPFFEQPTPPNDAGKEHRPTCASISHKAMQGIYKKSWKPTPCDCEKPSGEQG